jgi:UDP-N-acetyl-D-glucosamine dehydrogenase
MEAKMLYAGVPADSRGEYCMYAIDEPGMEESSSSMPVSYAVAKRFIHDRSARLGIVGLGYSGLRLVILFSNYGFAVDGFDLDTRKIEILKSKRSYLNRIPSNQIADARDRGFLPTTDLRLLHETDIIIICIGARLDKNRLPDLRAIRESTFSIASNLHAGHLIVVDSSTYPGLTKELIVPILENANCEHLKISHNTGAPNEVFVGVSSGWPDLGGTTTAPRDVPRVIAGIDRFGAQLTAELYGSVFRKIVPASTVSIAEITRLLQNSYHSVNSALVNEWKQVCLRMGIDPWEAIAAASIEPFDLRVSPPDLGVLGTTLLSDSLSLSWRAKAYGTRARLIETATEINSGIPEFVVNCTEAALNRFAKPVKGSRILLLGAACDDTSDDVPKPPALTIIELFRRDGAQVDVGEPSEPRGERIRHEDFDMTFVSTEDVSAYDAVVVAADQASYDYSRIVSQAELVIDIANATQDIQSEKIVRC